MKESVTATTQKTWILNISAFKTSNITQHQMYLYTKAEMHSLKSYSLQW